MLRFLTSGESHGKGLTAIIDGFPSNLKIDFNKLNDFMKLRKMGYGRGGRQAIETDKVEVLSGVRNSVTLGTPITLFVENKDFANWKDIMDSEICDVEKKQLTAVRPGHADLNGCLKYGHKDARNVLERASARETASRVAVGGICKQFLEQLGIRVCGYVYNIGGVEDKSVYDFEQIFEQANNSPMRVLNADVEQKMVERITKAIELGDTLGGKVRVVASGVKANLGDFVQYDKKIDAHLAFALMSIQAVKGVEIGDGFDFANDFGSKKMDEIVCQNGEIKRKTNHAGGVEGGMTNGENIIISACMKPIPTVKCGLETIDINTLSAVKSAFERSDACAVTALSVVAEAMVCFELAKFILSSMTNSNFLEIEKQWKNLKFL